MKLGHVIGNPGFLSQFSSSLRGSNKPGSIFMHTYNNISDI